MSEQEGFDHMPDAPLAIDPTTEQAARAGHEGMDWIDFAVCPACGEPIDHCQGHGEIGDLLGFTVLAAHDENVHDYCHPWADCR